MSRNVLIGLAGAVVVGVGGLFATGFWSADVNDPGKMPDVDISAEPGRAPDVDLDSKEVVVGTEKREVEVEEDNQARLGHAAGPVSVRGGGRASAVAP